MDSNCTGWMSIGNYPFTKIPYANSANLQWTIRDNQMINLPVALLVKGDMIKLRPGQLIFADCEISSEDCEKGYYQKTYAIGQTFVSDQSYDNLDNNLYADGYHKVIPMKSCITAVVTKTPITSLIDEYFINHTKTNANVVTVPERYMQFSIDALLIFVFVVFVLNVILHIIWFIFIGYVNALSWPAITCQILLIGIPIQLPLLISITLSNITWKVNCLRYKLERRATLTSNTVSMESIPSSLSLDSSDSDEKGASDVALDPMSVTISDYFQAHWDQIVNQDDQFIKMIYSLGSLTSLCCVDKKGILADPIATPEKIFFCRKKHRHRSSSLMNLDKSLIRKQNQDSLNKMNSNFDFLPNSRLRSITAEAKMASLDLKNIRVTGSENRSSETSHLKRDQLISFTDMNCSLSVPVILDMTRSNTHPFLPSFDDNRWERYISSLKPIGLNILLNNCNPDVTDRYINFIDNMSAINFKNLNKSQLSHRCICALATQIGFKPTASERFQLQSTFAVCRKHEKFNEINVTNCNHVYPLPVGSVFSTVVKDSIQNNYQLMSQGSVDLLIGMCSDYWDGKDISPLTAFDRSRILEFYNRNIFSSYCIGFSYSPLFNKIKFNDLDDQFILQILDGKIKNNTYIPKNGSVKKVNREPLVSNEFLIPKSNLSAKLNDESLLQSEEIKSLLKHQIFLGMISLQADQVQSDVIDCINRLEQACIRFVFFSTDNQLRSRVFAERLGMESGWNCHISLADPEESDAKGGHIQKTSSKGTKKSTPDDSSKDDLLLTRIYSSEPILNTTISESEKMNHSPTFNDPRLLTISKHDTEFISLKMTELEDVKSYDLSSSTTTTTRSTSKQRKSFLENPRDHFPEDKSKLPCGIKSIRPHLEQVDNVPLQVSLFTDCNPEVDHEMMSIMREYGEIICCCGSGLTVKNVPLFSSNDCAVAFVPILHKQCWRQYEIKPFDVAVLSTRSRPNKNYKFMVDNEPMLKKRIIVMDQKVGLAELSPINIACRLVALPCGLLLNRRAGFNLISFITECHRLVKNILSCIAFYCLSCANFVLLKLLFNLIILIFDLYYKNTNFPIGFDLYPTDLQVLYYLYFHTPILALTIYSRLTWLGKPLKEPSRKRGRLLTYKQCYRFIISSLGKFLPSILLCLFVLIWNLSILHPVQPIKGSPTNITSNHTGEKLILIEKVLGDFIFTQHNIYIVFISFAFIHPEKPFWKFNFLKHFRYFLMAFALIFLHLGYMFFSWFTNPQSEEYLGIIKSLQFPFILSLNGIVIVLIFCSIASYWENKELSVEHRLARLYFGTKLGMYSPV